MVSDITKPQNLKQLLRKEKKEIKLYDLILPMKESTIAKKGHLFLIIEQARYVLEIIGKYYSNALVIGRRTN